MPVVPGELRLRLGVSASPLTASHTADEQLLDGTPIEVWHRQQIFALDARLSADLGVAEHLAIQLEVPLRLFETTIRYEDLDGHEVAILGADIHHRDETLLGPGDPLVGARSVFVAGAWLVEGRVGLRLPLGHTEPNPYTPEASSQPHEHFQFGDGTLDPELGLTLQHTFADWSLGAWGFARCALYANSHGYQAGDRYAGGVFAASALGLADWRFALTLDVQGETAERWDDTAPADDGDDGNRGRLDVFGGLGVEWRPSAIELGLELKTPLYTKIVGGQLQLPLVIGLTVGGTLALGADTDASDHGADLPGDLADITTPTPVAGKLTVIDYWATWCAPCLVLRERLDAIARGHSWVAVRRLDVGAEAEPGMTLPFVRVFDRAGAIIYEGTGDPDALATDVEAIAHGKRPAWRR